MCIHYDMYDVGSVHRAEMRLMYGRCMSHVCVCACGHVGMCACICATPVLQWPSKNDGSAPNYQVACQLRIGVWLGLNQYSNDWLRGQDEGEISVFAETVSSSDFLESLQSKYSGTHALSWWLEVTS